MHDSVGSMSLKTTDEYTHLLCPSRREWLHLLFISLKIEMGIWLKSDKANAPTEPWWGF